MAAASQVWLIQELVQSILEFLTVDDLIFAQRVCRLWFSVIQTTPRLQELMFFQPDYTFSPKGPDGFTLNSLLKARFPRFFASPAGRPEFYTREQLTMTPLGRPREAWSRPDASWRRMLVVQPPVRTVEIQQWTFSRNYNTKQFGHVVDPEAALRMGWLYDFCWNSTAREHASFDAHFDMCRPGRWESKLTLELQYSMSSTDGVDYNPWRQQDHKAEPPTEVTWGPIRDLDGRM